MIEASETHFHCNATWHLVKLSRVAQSIYSLAAVVSKKSGKLSASAQNIGHFLGYSEKHVRRGLAELEDAGFFEFESGKNFETNVYRVIPHKEWAAKHPSSCAVKFDFGWKDTSDPLARQLYAVSGCKKKFLEYQTGLLRKTGLAEGVLIKEFESFLKQWKPQGKQDARYWFSRFYDTLKVRGDNPTELDKLVYALYQETGHVFFGINHTALTHMLGDGLSSEEIITNYRNALCEFPRRAMDRFSTEYEIQRVLLFRQNRAAIGAVN